MVFLLALTLVGAAVFSSHWSGPIARPKLEGPWHQGPLYRIQLPAGWRPVQTPKQKKTTITVLARFNDTEQNHRSLTLGLLPDELRRTPLEAIDDAVSDWRESHTIWDQQTLISLQRHTFLSRLANSYAFRAATDEGAFDVTVLVITEDGRRYHTLVHERLVDLDATPSTMLDTALLDAIAESLADPLRRDATPADLIDNDLAADESEAEQLLAAMVPEGMTLRADRGYGPIPMLQLIPDRRDAGFWMLRLRGELPLPETSDDALTVAAAMQNYGRWISGDPHLNPTLADLPDGGRSWTLSIAAPAVSSNVEQSLAMARQISYVKADASRTFLLETFTSIATSTTAFKAHDEAIAKVSDALLRSTSPRADRLLSAQQAGEVVGDIQRKHALASLPPGWNFELLTQGPLEVGAVATYVGDNVTNDALPKLIQSLMIYRPMSLKTDSTVQMSADGGQFVEVLTREQQAVSRRLGAADTITLTYQQGRLRAVQRDRGRSAELWQARAPGGFLPPGSDIVWPSDTLNRLAEQPALLWQVHHDRGPMPMLASAVRQGGDTGPWTLTLRPLLSIDSDTATIGKDGRAENATVFVHQTVRSLPMMLEIRRVGRSEFVRYLTSINERLVTPGEKN